MAIYARYSTDLQNPRSIDDQIRTCRDRAEREEWEVYECYADHAISGASIVRAGLQQMLQDARQAKFGTILTESLDRLSRDQADIAAIFKHMQFEDVEIVTLAEGRVGVLDIGVRGTMNQLYLVEIGKKVRRGQYGRVKHGRVPSGISFGYDVVRKFDGRGMPVRGERKINEAQARLIQWMFREYGIVGRTALQIAHALNKSGIPSPSGHRWNASTIGGNPHRAIGILNNEFYIGNLVWNRMNYILNPDTGKRVYRLNPESEWVRESVPWLRIIDQDLWDRVKERQRKRHSPRQVAALRMAKVRYGKHYPKYLLSGLLTCGSCGGGYALRRHDVYGCDTRHNKGMCDNRLQIKRRVLEDKVLGALKGKFVADPERCAAFCEAYAMRLKDLRMERRDSVRALKDEIDRLDGTRKGIVAELIRSPEDPEELRAELRRVTNLHSLVERVLAQTLEAIEIDRTLENHYPGQVDTLVDTLSSQRRCKDSYETFRLLIGEIVLRPNQDGTELGVELLGKAMKPRRRRKNVRRSPARNGGVAADGFEPPTKGL